MNHTVNDNPAGETASDADSSAISIEQANARIASLMPSFTGDQKVAIREARGRILSHPILSPIASPPFRASAMDGYAYRFDDSAETYNVVAKSFAGHPGPNKLSTGECVKVTTGAKVPDDADTVVQQENVACHGNTIVMTAKPTELGHHVRAKGSDCGKNSVIAPAGTVVNAGLIGLCAALGIEHVSVKRTISIAIISTGDELCEPGSKLQDGQIFDSNTTVLATLFDSSNFVVRELGHMKDDPDSVHHLLTEASDADVIITSGGVSVGERDHLRSVMEQRGGVDLWKVAMKPGRPLSFGLLDQKTPWFGLPGNPVSAALTSMLFVMPALHGAQGLPQAPLRIISAKCLNPLRKLPGRVEFQRGYLNWEQDDNITVSTTGIQDSHVLSSLSKANCFIRLSTESSGASVGEMVDVIPYEFFCKTLT